jgi:hypothetical protein
MNTDLCGDWAATRGWWLKDSMDRRDKVRWRLCSVCSSLLEDGAVYLHVALRHPGTSAYNKRSSSPLSLRWEKTPRLT